MIPVLQERFDTLQLSQALTPRSGYHPFSTADEREPWGALPGELRASLIGGGEERLGFEYPMLPATLFMEYARLGNRRNFEQVWGRRRSALAALLMAECVEGEGRFLDDIINGIWCACEESFWGFPAHNHSQRFSPAPLPDTADPIIDLFAGETAGLLAWTHYLLGARLDAISPMICDRIRREMKWRILDPYLDRTDYGWMGLARPAQPVNNWNPWCNSNCLAAALLLEEDEDRRLGAVRKCLHSLDRFLAVYHSDGGCDEGPSYWGRAAASLFDCLELLLGATDGWIDVFDEPLVANMGSYLYKAHIHEDCYANFADCGAKVGIPADLVYRYGKRIGDEKLMALGSSAHHLGDSGGKVSVVPQSPLRALPEVFNYAELHAGTDQSPYVRDAFLDGIHVMAAREREGAVDGLYVAFKGGHNAESHNHNDVGHFIVYGDGQPALIDVGVETYRRQTFSPQRYDIWTMQSGFHNVPTINGVEQADGLDYRARDVTYEMDDSRAAMGLELRDAYPEEAGIESWRRTVTLQRGGAAYVEIRDQFRLAEDSEIALTLMAAEEPAIGKPGRIALPAVTIEYDANLLEASFEAIEVDDGRLTPIWGDRVYRVLLTGNACEGELTIRVLPAP